MIAHGNCFEVALHVAVAEKATLVHGVPVGRGPANKGKRYAHAWVEANGLAFDFSNGLRLRLPVGVYYRKGKMSELHVRRYSAVEAAHLMLTHEHYGPWDQQLLDMEEVSYGNAHGGGGAKG